jgi:hypothetical protein
MRLFSAAGWSLTVRLSIYFALCSGVLIAGMGYVLYRESVQEFREEHIEQLAQRIDIVRQTLAGAHNEDILAAGAEPWKEFALPASPMRIAVFDEHGNVLLSPTSFPVPATELPPPSSPDEIATSTVTRGADNGRRYRVVTTWAVAAGPAPTRVMLAMALDISASARRMETYHRTLLATLIAVVGSRRCGRLRAPPTKSPPRTSTGTLSLPLHRPNCVNWRRPSTRCSTGWPSRLHGCRSFRPTLRTSCAGHSAICLAKRRSRWRVHAVRTSTAM